jgi:hypothetical protein
MGKSSLPKDSPPQVPKFPEFRALRLEDREVVHDIIWAYQPETSELTFTNLFIWQAHYGFAWSLDRDWLLLVSDAPERGGWALPPVGPPGRRETCRRLLTWLAEEKGAASPQIRRADRRLVDELAPSREFVSEPQRDHFDYLYRAEDLINLAGNKYHSKRNHLHVLERSQQFSYEPLEERHLPACRELAAAWCSLKRCEADLGLLGEWEAVAAALNHLQALKLHGGVILVDGRVEAFSLGELLNRDTAVIHVEKANPDLRGLYAVINQRFCQHAWAGVPFINREQDLGEPGLRQAKLSYHPHHLVEKFSLGLERQ